MTYKDLKIVYEDNHILVVVKPYDVPVQADESGDPDMLTMLKQYLVEKYNKPGEAYLGLVHRLVNKKPIVASEEELQNNPRSQSAKLRIVERL